MICKAYLGIDFLVISGLFQEVVSLALCHDGLILHFRGNANLRTFGFLKAGWDRGEKTKKKEGGRAQKQQGQTKLTRLTIKTGNFALRLHPLISRQKFPKLEDNPFMLLREENALRWIVLTFTPESLCASASPMEASLLT